MVHIRSEREIKKIAKSCQIVADTLLMLEPFIIKGAKVSDLDKMAEEFIRSKGARPAFKGYMGFPSTLCVSIEDAVVHGIPGEDILNEGEIVGVDCGAELDGYYGDHAKSFPIGKIDEKKKKLLKITHESLLDGSEKQGYQLKSGMCIAIEPMINAGKKDIYTASDGWTILTKDGSASAHFEHTIAITESGPKILSIGSNG